MSWYIIIIIIYIYTTAAAATMNGAEKQWSPSFTPRAQWHRFQLLSAGQILQALSVLASHSPTLDGGAKTTKNNYPPRTQQMRNRFRGLLCTNTYQLAFAAIIFLLTFG